MPNVNAPVSWWVGALRPGFTARAEAEAERMRANPQFTIASLGDANAYKAKPKKPELFDDEAA